MIIFLKTSKKTLLCDQFMSFLPKFVKNGFFWKKGYQFLNTPIIYDDAKIYKKTNNPLLRKIPN